MLMVKVAGVGWAIFNSLRGETTRSFECRWNIVRILTDVRFSVWPSQSQPWERVLSLIRYADDNGWYGAWVADHFMPSTYSSPTVQDNSRAASGDVTECFSLLRAAAAATQHARLGSLV